MTWMGLCSSPLGVAVHALDLARVPLGATVAVVGMGAIGLLIAQVARVAGAGEVHAVEPLAYRRELALELRLRRCLRRLSSVCRGYGW